MPHELERFEERKDAPPIGSSIRDRRKRLGLTLRQVATSSGLSTPFLSQVERDEATPSLVSLGAIAAALQVEIGYFLGTPKPGQIVRRASDPDVLEFGAPATYHRLSGAHDERKMEALRIEVPPGLQTFTAQRSGEGFWYVMTGKLEVWVGREHFILGPGDSAHFELRHGYRMRNPGKKPVLLLWVGTPALLPT